eukprot:318784-Prymnesium_polylepis.1
MFGVGCPEFGRKPFRGLPGEPEDRMSGLNCAGNIRIGALAVDPYHLTRSMEPLNVQPLKWRLVRSASRKRERASHSPFPKT